MISAEGADGASRAAAALRAGEVVAIPTDTVYGLAAAHDQPAAIERLFTMKGRPTSKAIPVLVSDLESASLVAASLPPLALDLATRFWPGALTLVVPAVPELPLALTSRDDRGRTVAIRIPNHRLALEVIALAGGALAVTSANRSGDAPALRARDVAELGSAAPDVVLDGGVSPGGIASTVVLVTRAEPIVLREGAISAAAITAALR